MRAPLLSGAQCASGMLNKSFARCAGVELSTFACKSNGLRFQRVAISQIAAAQAAALSIRPGRIHQPGMKRVGRPALPNSMF
jgi:hypothetical protein